MTIGMCIFLGILYAIIGAFVGYCMLSEDTEGILFGIFIWPIFLGIMFIFMVLELLLKFVAGTVNIFKRLGKVKWKKDKGSLGLGTDEKNKKTICDRCPHFWECHDNGKLDDISEPADAGYHFTLRLGEICRRGIDFVARDIYEEEIK